MIRRKVKSESQKWTRKIRYIARNFICENVEWQIRASMRLNRNIIHWKKPYKWGAECKKINRMQFGYKINYRQNTRMQIECEDMALRHTSLF